MNQPATTGAPIPFKTWAAASGAVLFTALLLRILTASWPHAVEGGAVVGGLFVVSFVAARAFAEDRRR